MTPEILHKEAMEHYERVKKFMRRMEQERLPEGAGRDSDGGEPLPIEAVDMKRTKEAVSRAEDLSIAASELFETLEHLYAVMQRIQEEQDTEIITDEDQHPGCNNASTWL